MEQIDVELSKIYYKCSDLVAVSSSLFPENKGAVSNCTYFFEDGSKLWITALGLDRFIERNNIDKLLSSVRADWGEIVGPGKKRTSSFRVRFTPTILEVLRLREWRGFRSSPVLEIRKTDDDLSSYVNCYPNNNWLTGAPPQDKKIMLGEYPNPLNLLKRVQKTLEPNLVSVVSPVDINGEDTGFKKFETRKVRRPN